MDAVRRFLPILEWLPRYDRRWLRGDVAAGIAVTALIVPKNLGYAGIAGVPLENGLYAAAAGALIYALFCTSRQISTGPSSSLAAVAGGAVLVTGLGGDQAAQLVAAITLLTGVLFLLACPVEAGLDRSVSLQGGRDRFPRRRGGRRHGGRAAEADRNLGRRRHRLAGARFMGARAGRHPLGNAPGRGRRARGDSRAAFHGARGPGRARARRWRTAGIGALRLGRPRRRGRRRRPAWASGADASGLRHRPSEPRR